MALLGSGVLAIWNNIQPQAAADFDDWHVNEHFPERVGVPGFLRGRRYLAYKAEPAYFNFYEAESADIFSSAPYRARLDNPTPWTQRVIAQFVDTSRTACDVVASHGLGEAGWLETLQLQGASPAALAKSLPALVAQPGITGAHLLRGRPAAATLSAEQKLRGTADQTVELLLLIEAVEPELLGEAALPAARFMAGGLRRGIYRLHYALSRDEMERHARSSIDGNEKGLL